MRKFIRYRRAWPLLQNASPSIPSHSSSLSIVTCDRALLSSELQCRGFQFNVKSFSTNPEVSPAVATLTSEVLLSFLPPRSSGSSQQYGRTLQPCSVPDTVQRRLSSRKHGTLFVTPLLPSSHSQVRRNSSLAPLLSYDRVFCTDDGSQSEVLEEKDFYSSSRSDAVCSDSLRDNQIRSSEGESPATNSTSEVNLEPNQGWVPHPQKKVPLLAGLKYIGSSKPADDYVGIKTGDLHAIGREITASIKRDDSRHWEKEGPRQWRFGPEQPLQGFRMHVLGPKLVRNVVGKSALSTRLYSTDGSQVSAATKAPEAIDHSQRAVVVALCCNFLVFALKIGVWIVTSSHVMLAESIHSLADLANQGLLAYGLISSRRAPDALHPYGYTKERFVWSLISAVGIFCLGSGATIVHGVQNLWSAQPLENIMLAAAVIAGSALMEGASFVVAYGAVKKGASAEGMTMREYLWRGHDPTSVAVLMEDGAAVAGLAVAGLALAAVEFTGNPIWDPIGSIVVGNLLGVVAIFLIQRNRQALLGRSIDDVEMRRVINLLIADPVVEGLYDCKSEVIGPGAYRFKAEIDFNGVVIVQNYLQRAGRDTWMREFREAVNHPDGSVLDRVMAEYGEEVVSALGCEVDRLEKEIQRIVPGIRHVDIEAHNPNGPAPREKFYLSAVEKTG